MVAIRDRKQFIIQQRDNEMPDEQQIYDKIRDQVKSIMPDEAKEFIFRVKLYPGSTTYTSYWFRKDGRRDGLDSMIYPVVLVIK